jgi:AcrR family transcriptional regulator
MDASGERGESGEPGEEPWPFYRYPRTYPRSGRASREERHEQRITGHIQRHREHGTQPLRRDRGLSRDEIVRAAIALADAEGPDAISMRRIARELRAGAMSLYWHVGSKEELLDLMLESIEAEVEVPEPSGDWRADLRAFARRTRAGMLRHRWAMEFLGGRPPSGPNDARNLERLLGMLDGLGLDAGTTMDILGTLATYVMGAVIRQAQEIRGQRDQELAEADLTTEELQAERERYRKWFETSGRYPRIARLMEAGIDPDDPETRDERFEFGLDCVLDGIAARLRPASDLLALAESATAGPESLAHTNSATGAAQATPTIEATFAI